ncbi:MAG: AAA family ATPase, partial [Candidatus Delongbacteria bacterium]|nr:AAA family ATPase [Candidatus Delongbacteria bacterium]
MKKIPYGIANFEALKEESSYYYVDKTRYIEELENLGTKYHFFLRPRRFGKSLFISMLEHYYDINRKNQFDDLFGDTYIGKNPTKLRNSFPILKLNFSGIPTNGSEEEIEYSFNINIKGSVRIFYVFYSDKTGGEKQFEKDFENVYAAGDIIGVFFRKMYELGVKYYLLIDEYDNFANNILIHHGKENYTRVTHQAGFLRSFFAAIKVATESRTVER